MGGKRDKNCAGNVLGGWEDGRAGGWLVGSG